ncbi:hypothetical protein NCER_101439 [Vairimorpha ceranae BRL01]|uniref:Mediator complex subunit 15 KIX domain-containing protein n=2 Tax=Vairimorpha ceranae TaxID=40302 RepID=C4VA13_VAIC1|nr:mads domain-containing protein [Vairimorpha ceranae]EEQ81937.1 hypothetical protein NCER_101439 [Vairimorpha ceranae BRL01]KAF5139848.1 hypothetical protein G9O61_00g020180 [Vairimorpha ceranae]KKO74920.1 mads domain-containing protein [Vairimorpha ceranae]
MISQEERKQIVLHLFKLIKESKIFSNCTDKDIKDVALKFEAKAFNSSKSKEEYMKLMKLKFEKIINESKKTQEQNLISKEMCTTRSKMGDKELNKRLVTGDFTRNVNENVYLSKEIKSFSNNEIKNIGHTFDKKVNYSKDLDFKMPFDGVYKNTANTNTFNNFSDRRQIETGTRDYKQQFVNFNNSNKMPYVQYNYTKNYANDRDSLSYNQEYKKSINNFDNMPRGSINSRVGDINERSPRNNLNFYDYTVNNFIPKRKSHSENLFIYDNKNQNGKFNTDRNYFNSLQKNQDLKSLSKISTFPYNTQNAMYPTNLNNNVMYPTNLDNNVMYPTNLNNNVMYTSTRPDNYYPPYTNVYSTPPNNFTFNSPGRYEDSIHKGTSKSVKRSKYTNQMYENVHTKSNINQHYNTSNSSLNTNNNFNIQYRNPNSRFHMIDPSRMTNSKDSTAQIYNEQYNVNCNSSIYYKNNNISNLSSKCVNDDINQQDYNTTISNQCEESLEGNSTRLTNNKQLNDKEDDLSLDIDLSGDEQDIIKKLKLCNLSFERKYLSLEDIKILKESLCTAEVVQSKCYDICKENNISAKFKKYTKILSLQRKLLQVNIYIIDWREADEMLDFIKQYYIDVKDQVEKESLNQWVNFNECLNKTYSVFVSKKKQDPEWYLDLQEE